MKLKKFEITCQKEKTVSFFIIDQLTFDLDNKNIWVKGEINISVRNWLTFIIG